MSDAVKRTFFRVNHEDTQQGLWYDFCGNHTGFIHDRFSFCQNHALMMDFDPAIVGYISAVETLEQLYAWFTQDDILRLQSEGYFIHAYEATDYKWYDKFEHYAIHQQSSRPACKYVLLESKPVAATGFDYLTNDQLSEIADGPYRASAEQAGREACRAELQRRIATNVFVTEQLLTLAEHEEEAEYSNGMVRRAD